MGKTRTARLPASPLSEAALEQAALRYLERYASSAAGLRRVLRRRVRRLARTGSDEAEAGDRRIEAVLRGLLDAGLLDDSRYAEARAASQARRGASLFAIRRDLAARGVAVPLIDAALAALKRDAGGTGDAADAAAALALARRRRLGPFRSAATRAAFRLRDLAVLGRAGFAFGIARRVVDGEPENG